MRNKYTTQFQNDMIALAPFYTLDELLKFAKKQYKTITKNQLRKYLSKRKIRYKDYNENMVKGNQGDNVPIGTERVKPDGYVQVKITKDKWEYKQRLIYSKYHNVKLKSDDYVIFLDHNKNNFDINNLKRISRKESAITCRIGGFSNDPNITKLGINIAKLILKNSDKKGEIKNGK